MIYSENILLCIAIPLLLAVFYTRGGTRHFLLALLIGMVICLLSSYISGYLTLVAATTPDDSALYISPIVEEIMKLLPLLFLLLVFRPGDLTLATIATGIGIGFATFENCCYLLASGSVSLAFTLVRGLAAGVMHVVCMTALSLSLIMVRRYRVFTFAGVAGTLSLSVTFHALYNLLVSVPGIPSYIGYSLPLAAALVFYWPYRKILSMTAHSDDPK